MSELLERLKKLMQEKNMTQHDISVDGNFQLSTVGRFLRTGKCSPAYQRLFDIYLTSKGY